MSLLAPLATGFQQVATNFIGRIFGANNRSPLGDCQAQVGLIGLDRTITQYPQCGPLLAGSGQYGGSPMGMAPAPMISGAVPMQSQLQTFAGNNGFQQASFLTSPQALNTLRALPGAGKALATVGAGAA